jgi:hypothetical protein
LDVAALFMLPPRDADLNHILTLVQVEQAPDRDVTMSICWDNLEGEVQRMCLLEQGPLLARHPGDPTQLC